MINDSIIDTSDDRLFDIEIVIGRSGQLVGGWFQEDPTERLSILPAHRAVEHEIDGTVHEREDVPDIPERGVHGVEYLAVDPTHEGDDALRKFGEDEGQDDGD